MSILSLAVRKQLWLTHGCSLACLYGDDGEMQCASTWPFIDFKEDSEEQILFGIEKHKIARQASYQESLKETIG